MAFSAGNKLRASALNLLDLIGSSDQDLVTTTEASSSTTFADLATVGPSVTITSKGTTAIVFIQTWARTPGGTGSARAAVDVSGATTISGATNETNGFYTSNEGQSSTLFTPVTTLAIVTINPGTNTYKIKYRSTSGGGGSWQNRRIVVLAP